MKFKELPTLDGIDADRAAAALRQLAGLGLDTDWTQARPLYGRGVRYAPAPLAIDLQEEWKDVPIARPDDRFFETHPQYRALANQREISVPQKSWHIVVHMPETTR